MAARIRGSAVTLFFLLVAGLTSGTHPAILHIRNDWDRAVHINAITLDQCTNLREWCSRYRKDVVLRPGQGVRIHTVHP